MNGHPIARAAIVVPVALVGCRVPQPTVRQIDVSGSLGPSVRIASSSVAGTGR